MLVVPLSHNNSSRKMKEIEISYAENWQKEHFKTLESAYRRSPYFEYYGHYFEDILSQKTERLFDYNVHILEQILSILKTEVQINITSRYESSIAGDLREKFKAKEEPVSIPEYMQVFEEKNGFITDLSIIDLICNEGPRSLEYLKNL